MYEGVLVEVEVEGRFIWYMAESSKRLELNQPHYIERSTSRNVSPEAARLNPMCGDSKFWLSPESV